MSVVSGRFCFWHKQDESEEEKEREYRRDHLAYAAEIKES
jgi:hypothetical protein